MEQLSLPYRIALIAIALIGAVWFVALRPKSDPVPAAAPSAATAPGVKGLSTAIDKAKGAAAQSDAANAAAGADNFVKPSVTPTGTSAAPGSSAAASDDGSVKDRAAGTDRSAAILADLRAGRVAVLAFAGKKAADDLQVRGALGNVDRHGGKVVVRAVSIDDVADYGAITEGVKVGQSPTVVVIGKNRKARTIVGITDSQEIDQLVGDLGGKGF